MEVTAAKDGVFNFAPEIVVALIANEAWRKNVFFIPQAGRDDMFACPGIGRVTLAKYTVENPLLPIARAILPEFHASILEILPADRSVKSRKL